MLAIELEFLTGHYVATAYDNRDLPEWPPHPARVFSALVATWASAGKPPAETAALEWLQQQPAPTIYASETHPRDALPVFVPVNDTSVVSPPSTARQRVNDAQQKLAAAKLGGKPKAITRAQKALAKAKQKLRDDTAKRIAASKITSDGMKAAVQLLPGGRNRQARSFPSVNPLDPRVRLSWNATPPSSVRDSLCNMCRRLVRVGHSSSFVRATVLNGKASEITHLDVFNPTKAGPITMRIPMSDQLDKLVTAHESHREVAPRVLPCSYQSYRRGDEMEIQDVQKTLFDPDWYLFVRRDRDPTSNTSGKGLRLPHTATVAVAEALRGALQKHCPRQPPPAIISGHEEDGRPGRDPHLAIVPLPYVASHHADGQILGIAVILPRTASENDRREVADAISEWEQNEQQHGQTPGHHDFVPGQDTPVMRLRMGRAGTMLVQRLVYGQPNLMTLRTSTWTSASHCWVSATPIALDRNPGNLHDRNARKRAKAFAEATKTIQRACTHVRLPQPAYVDVVRAAVLPGTTKPQNFPPFPLERRKHRRVLVHARLWFDEPVAGPVLLGAGRFFGLGLCRPIQLPKPEAKP